MTDKVDPGIQLLQPRHPGWPSGELQRFDHYYDLHGSASYALHESSRDKRYYGSPSPRVCALCGRSAPVVSFDHEAHALPAALGNRRLFSLEECDLCNGRYSKWENELVNMFAPERIFGGVRGREGPPKISLHKMSRIEAPAPNEIRIYKHGHDDSIVLDMGDGMGSGTLTLNCPSYSPVRAALALLRSLWLVMDTGQRSRAPELLRAIQAGEQPINTQLHKFTKPGAGYPRVTLAGWAKKSPGVIPGSTFILQFVFVDTVLTWAWSDEGGHECPTLLPPFPGVPGHKIHTGRYKLHGPEHRVEDSQLTYHLLFDRVVPLTEGDVSAAIAPKAPPQQKIPVTMEADAEGGPRVLRANLYVDQWGPDRRTFRLQGGQWPGRIVLTLGPTDEKGSFNIKFIAHHLPAGEAVRAAEFLEALRVSRALRVRLAETNAEVLRVGLGPEPMSEVGELPLLRDLALIHETFGKDVRIPKRVTPEFLEDASYVASVLRTGQVEFGRGTASFVAPNDSAAKLTTEFERAKAAGNPNRLRLEGGVVTAVLDGHDLNLGLCTQELDADGVKVSPADETTCRVVVSFVRRVDRFAQWPAPEFRK